MKETLTFDDIQILPIYSEISSRDMCDISTKFTKNFKIKIPIVSSPMDTVTGEKMAIEISKLGGVGCLHRFMSIDEQIKEIQEIVKHIEYPKTTPICASIGVKNYEKRLDLLIRNGANVILIDVAHGNTLLVKNTIKYIKKNYDVDVIAGNVATFEGAENLCKWGADAVRCGIGNGSVCETRIRSGIGVPQVTAIMDCVKACKKYDVPLIADGGIRLIGDVAKALSLGADTVMLGSLLSGTKESPGNIQKIGKWPNEQLYKKYRGSASLDTKISNKISEKNVEGNSTLVPYKGKIKRLIGDICDGLKSSMSYTNSLNLDEFKKNSKFVRITQNGLIEAKPHLLK